MRTLDEREYVYQIFIIFLSVCIDHLAKITRANRPETVYN